MPSRPETDRFQLKWSMEASQIDFAFGEQLRRPICSVKDGRWRLMAARKCRYSVMGPITSYRATGRTV